MKMHDTGSYRTLFAAVVASTAVMYSLTYLNSWSASDVMFSQTRLWMSLMMGSAMAVVMLIFMRPMYTNRFRNGLVVVASAVTFALSLWLVRSQQTVRDVGYLEAMVPHHSIAVLTSRRARIHDPRVRELADGIIATQEREITRMQTLIDDLQRHPVPDSAATLRPAAIPEDRWR
ncbi:MAG TPA: DUF305 domain-containing protein [Steroidobacteraceae bacterium]|nr:DUF305 domain-containing protein [Steroidobacteraceae bacterium]